MSVPSQDEVPWILYPTDTVVNVVGTLKKIAQELRARPRVGRAEDALAPPGVQGRIFARAMLHARDQRWLKGALAKLSADTSDGDFDGVYQWAMKHGKKFATTTPPAGAGIEDQGRGWAVEVVADALWALHQRKPNAGTRHDKRAGTHIKKDALKQIAVDFIRRKKFYGTLKELLAAIQNPKEQGRGFKPSIATLSRWGLNAVMRQYAIGNPIRAAKGGCSAHPVDNRMNAKTSTEEYEGVGRAALTEDKDLADRCDLIAAETRRRLGADGKRVVAHGITAYEVVYLLVLEQMYNCAPKDAIRMLNDDLVAMGRFDFKRVPSLSDVLDVESADDSLHGVADTVTDAVRRREAREASGVADDDDAEDGEEDAEDERDNGDDEDEQDGE